MYYRLLFTFLGSKIVEVLIYFTFLYCDVDAAL
jgi:hypothetical protein